MNSKKSTPIEKSPMFLAFLDVANFCWRTVKSWPHFEQSAIGQQLVKAADSVGANILEGTGRYSQADSLRFLIIARASAREARYWLFLCDERGLIDSTVCRESIGRLNEASRQLNAFITYRRRTDPASVKESRSSYGGEENDPLVELSDEVWEFSRLKTQDFADGAIASVSATSRRKTTH